MLRFLNNWKVLKLFQKHSEFNKWPVSILLQIIFLNRAYIRELCCYCNKTLRFKRSENIVGDSGEICPTFLRRECPELYEEMKATGKFTSEQIQEAESQ